MFFPQTLPLIPLNRLASRLRRSVEGLNLELEEVFVSEKPEDQHEVRALSYSFSALAIHSFQNANYITFGTPSFCHFNWQFGILTFLLNVLDFGCPRWPQGTCSCPAM